MRCEEHQLNISKLLVYLITACAIGSVSMYAYLDVSVVDSHWIIFAGMCLCILFLLTEQKIDLGFLPGMLSLGGYFLLYMAVTGWSTTFARWVMVQTMVLFAFGHQLSRGGRLCYFTEAYVNIMAFFAFVSLVCYLFGTQLKLLPGRTPMHYFWAEHQRDTYSYFFLYFENPIQRNRLFGITLMRNTGIFPEAPGYAAFLSYAIALELVSRARENRKSKKKLYLLMLTLLTTFSAKGLLVMLLVCVLWYWMETKRILSLRSLILCLGTVAAVIAGVYVLKDKSTTSSYGTRMDDLISELKTWGDHVLFGVGYDNTDAIREYQTVERANEGLSMGVPLILALGGVYLLGFYALSALNYLRQKGKEHRFREGFLLTAVLALDLVISNVGFKMPYLMLMVFGLCYRAAPPAGECAAPGQQKRYDYLVVGAGLYGAVFAHEAMKRGKTVLVIEKRPHIGGNVYTEAMEGIQVHKYGAHIFHTDDQEIWDYVNQFAEFHRHIHSPIANYKGQLYALPVNMHTFHKLWGVVTPEEAAAKIAQQRTEVTAEPKNLEEQAISQVGRDVFERLIKGYMEKQWGRDCRELPASIIDRLPVRLNYDQHYFDAAYQGVPVGGYTKMVENMLRGADVRLGVDYLEHKAELDALAKKVVYTGPIDAYFGFQLGALEYRCVHLETQVLDMPSFQGNAVVNYTDRETPWTRIIEHKWFAHGEERSKTVVSREFCSQWQPGKAPCCPINDGKNNALYDAYRRLAAGEEKVIFGGCLGEYRRYDMDQVIAAALAKCGEEL